MAHFRISNWAHDPSKRKHRWRCSTCGRIIQDGSDVVVERRGSRTRRGHWGQSWAMGSLGFHGDCWDNADGDAGVMARSNNESN